MCKPFLDYAQLQAGSYYPVACLVVLFLTEEAWSHGGLRTRELGQTPLVLE